MNNYLLELIIHIIIIIIRKQYFLYGFPFRWNIHLAMCLYVCFLFICLFFAYLCYCKRLFQSHSEKKENSTIILLPISVLFIYYIWYTIFYVKRKHFIVVISSYFHIVSFSFNNNNSNRNMNISEKKTVNLSALLFCLKNYVDLFLFVIKMNCLCRSVQKIYSLYGNYYYVLWR